MDIKILYYGWGAVDYDLEDMFKRLEIKYTRIEGSVAEGLNSREKYNEIENEIINDNYDCIFTYDFFPPISEIAEKNHIKYISWIYDCPHSTLYSEKASNECNYFFIFDKTMEDALKAMGAKNVYKMPLGVNTNKLNVMLGNDITNVPYKYDISFLGSLYENSPYDQITYLPERVKGFLDGVMQSAMKLPGINIVDDILDEKITNELEKYIKWIDDPEYKIPFKARMSDIISRKITSMERIEYLNAISDVYKVDLFSGSDKALCSRCVSHGYVDYNCDMPIVFRYSKINLNISLRSIKTGIPLRCLDIMGAGGFLISNYQEDLCRYFEPGKDFVIYENLDDLLVKIQYYLENSEERTKIALNGWRKIQRFFNIDMKFCEMLQFVQL
ncbi:glycosyltransferase [Eubacterium sp. MSJ-13]|uniref:glycosyltransferase family protein n=1 Tax=Eubacterium sp. MSJ-13 TaxID=2841513 RepID=UPI001C11DD34|nr:DUF3880 domain-containing protein [Eubacterium sp. MSJ-13]MBU5477776.1 glycosyltransferase [Eubacterium sp. MSJ-13]